MHVAFDIGNVLCDLNLKIFTCHLQEIIDRQKIPLSAWSWLESIQPFQDIGNTTVRQSLVAMMPNINSGLLNELINSWDKTVIPNETMLRFMENLRSEGIQIALLSNMGKEHSTYLRSKYPELFSNTKEHLSCDVGARKPTKLFYQSFLLDNSEFKGALYLDDLEENLKAGKKFAFKTYWFKLHEFRELTLSKQKQELDQIKSFILNRMSTGTSE